MRNKYATHVDFTFLSEVAGKMIPSNIDMVAERRGRFLIGEWKRPSESISLGQQILLNTLARMPQFTVLIITGHSDNDETEVESICKLSGNGAMEEIGKSVKDLKSIYLRWLNI
jgi:hypothetical protein